MTGLTLAQQKKAKSSTVAGVKTLRISVSFSGTYFLLLVVSMLFVAYQFAQSNAYYFSLCLLLVSLVSLANALYQTARLQLRLPASILVVANTPFMLPINANNSLPNAECELQDGAWLPLLAASRDGRYTVSMAPQVRGEYPIKRVRVRRYCALGVFLICKDVSVDSRIYVYPEPKPLAHDNRDDSEALDLHPYRVGDAVHRIDWRGAARGRELHCYRNSEQQAEDIYLSLNSRAELESDLARLAAEVLERSKSFGNFGLRLGPVSVTAGQGEAHVAHCLRQLAAYSAPPITAQQGLAAQQARRLQMQSSESNLGDELDDAGETPANKGLLFLCALSSLSVYVMDPLWLPLLFCLGALVWRLFRAPLSSCWRNQIFLSLFVMAGAVYQCLFLGSVFSFYTAVSYLSLALGSKLLFFKPRRDALATVSLFCLISGMAFYNSDHPLQVLMSLTSLFSGMLYVLSIQQSDISGYRISALLSTAIVFASVCYALFPPPEKALWSIPLGGQNTSIGLADEVTPGSMSRLSQNQRTVFQASLDPRLSRSGEYFWRASVFDYFDGRAWRRGNTSSFTWVAFNPRAAAATAPSNYRYTIKFDSLQDNRLFILDGANGEAHFDIDHIESDQGEIFLGHSNQALRQYSVSLAPQAARAAPYLDPEQQARYLQLPDAVAPKTRHMVAQWLQQGGGKSNQNQLITKVLAFFANNSFIYSTENVRIEGDLVDGFVFASRKGYCEHYASAFVLMMRAAGIPARVVTGYAGADYHSDGDYYVVRQSFAHAWAEVWLNGHGWQRIDPTAYVADNEALRINQVKRLSALLRQLAASLSWVSQMNPLWLLALFVAILLILVLRPWLKRLSVTLRLLPKTPLNKPTQVLELAAANCYRQLQSRCRRHGIAIDDSDDIESCSDKISASRPDLIPAVREFTHIYNHLRYAQDKAWTQLQRLHELQKQIKL